MSATHCNALASTTRSVNCLRKVNTRTLEEMNSLPLYVASSVTSPKSVQGVVLATPKKTPKKSTKTQTANDGANTPKDSKIKASPPPSDKVSYLNFHCLKQVEAFVTSFRSYFLSSALGLGSSMAGATDETVVEKAPVWTGKDARVQAGLSRDQVTLATTAVKDAVSKIISGYLDTIGSFLIYPVGENITWILFFWHKDFIVDANICTTS